MAKRNTYFQDEVIERKIDIKQLKRVLKYLIPYKIVFYIVLILMLMSAIAAMVSPKVLGYIIDQVVPAGNYWELILCAVGMMFLMMFEIAMTFIHQRLMGEAGHGIIAEIRKDIFYKLQKLPFDYFDSKPDGKIVVRVTDYVNDLANFFTNYVVLFVIYIVKILVATVFMLSLSTRLTLVVMFTVIPMMFLVLLLRYSIRKLFGAHRAKISNRTAFLVECIMGEKIIKSYNRSEMSREIYEEIHDTSVRHWMRIVYRNELNTPIVEILWNVGTLLLYYVALKLMNAGDAAMTAGIVVMFTNYMTQFSGPLTQIAVIIQQLAQVTANLEQVFDTIDHPVSIRNSKKAVELKNVLGKVDFNAVTFSYEDDVTILENFELHVSPGETIALVGSTGAGKTTVINMLTRFYDVMEGSVMIDGVDVRDATLESLRREVGVLMQDPFIFKGTILDNIRYGRNDATDEECIEAAKMVYADHFISHMPDGYKTELEERGDGLSAGEKQLISFARIILKNPSIIILDEATSSIDTETEALIQKALDIILKNKTAFIVAHRLSTIRNADRILYICNKGIAEEGTHEELMDRKGLYYALN